MNFENSTLDIIALSKVKNVGPINARTLISYCGSAAGVFNTRKSQLIKIPGIGDLVADEVINANTREAAEEELVFSEKNNIEVITYLDPKYPIRLARNSDAPLVIYYKGNANFNQDRILSIVGTRNITNYGYELVDKLIQELKHINPIIISGLAYGVDTAVHRKCVAEEISTIGVLGHGLDKIYPSQNRELAHKMIERGGLLTEFGINIRPDRENFPMRNRIVAAMCDALVIVETKETGGSMITAELGFDYSKDVFAFPGRVNDIYSRGTNALIKSNKAQLIESAADLLKFMSWDDAPKSKKVQSRNLLFADLNEDEQSVIDLLNQQSPIHIDQFYQKLQKTPSSIATILLELEFKGLIHEQPGKRYTIIG